MSRRVRYPEPGPSDQGLSSLLRVAPTLRSTGQVKA